MNSSLQIEEPKYFGLRQVLIANLFSGALLAVPSFTVGCAIGGVLAAVFVAGGEIGGLLSFLSWCLTNPAFLMLLPIGLIILGLSVFFWPVLVTVNPYIRYIVGKYSESNNDSVFSAVCQISLSPRVYTGFRGFMEDADDVGQLQISQSSLRFTGDHIKCFLPFSAIEKICCRNIGWRGLWLYGHRIQIHTNAFGRYETLELLERHSSTIISSYRITNKIISLIKKPL